MLQKSTKVDGDEERTMVVERGSRVEKGGEGERGEGGEEEGEVT